MKGNNPSRDNVREKAAEIRHYVLIHVRAIDEQEMYWLVPSFRELPANSSDRLDVFRQLAAVDVRAKFLKGIITLKVWAAIEGVNRKHALFGPTARKAQATG